VRVVLAGRLECDRILATTLLEPPALGTSSCVIGRMQYALNFNQQPFERVQYMPLWGSIPGPGIIYAKVRNTNITKHDSVSDPPKSGRPSREAGKREAEQMGSSHL